MQDFFFNAGFKSYFFQWFGLLFFFFIIYCHLGLSMFLSFLFSFILFALVFSLLILSLVTQLSVLDLFFLAFMVIYHHHHHLHLFAPQAATRPTPQAAHAPHQYFTTSDETGFHNDLPDTFGSEIIVKADFVFLLRDRQHLHRPRRLLLRHPSLPSPSSLLFVSCQ